MNANEEFCHICKENEMYKPCTVWCSECEQMYCSDCELCHTSIRTTKGHVTISIEHYLELDESIRQIRTRCSNHDEGYQLFCQTHDVPICPSCMEQHSDCVDVTALRKTFQNIQNSERIRVLEQSLSEIGTNVSKIKLCLQKNREHLDENKTKLMSEIRQTRDMVNKYLDEIENRLTKEVSDLHNKAKNQLDGVLQSLNENTNILIDINEVNILKKHASDLHTFLVVNKIHNDTGLSQNHVESIIANQNFDQLTLECRINKKLENLSSDIKTFGEVRLQKTPLNITFDRHPARQAQDVVYDNSFDKLKRNSIKTEAKLIRGCDVTSDGRILFTDYSDKSCLICIDTKGNHLFDISTAPNRAFDVACIDDTNVAVTSSVHKVISIIDINRRAIKKHIDVGFDCYGVTHREGTLLVCARDQGVLSINLTNEEITTIVQCNSLPNMSYITTYKDKLYFSDNVSQTVTCCDMKGYILWTFKNKSALWNPLGITTDNEGRVYVCDNVKDRVIVLSADGKQSRSFFSSTPYAIQFDHTANIVVANESCYFSVITNAK